MLITDHPIIIVVCPLLCLLCYYALLCPLCSVILGKSIQPYHFPDRWLRISTYALLVLFLLLARALVPVLRWRFSARWWQRFWNRGLGFALLLFAGVITVYRSTKPPPTKLSHVRADFPAYGALQDYRASFIELVAELSSERYESAKILGTLDHQVGAWWNTYERRFFYLSDPFSNTVSDDENENRLNGFFKLLGASSQSFAKSLPDQHILIFFLAHQKYQASRAYSFAPPEEYEPATQERIAHGSIYESWPVFLPSSEMTRLTQKYEQTGLDELPFALPDVIVLTTHETSRELRPSSDLYAKVFSNATFEVWRSRKQMI